MQSSAGRQSAVDLSAREMPGESIRQRHGSRFSGAKLTKH
jgi:hypothetical protein